MKKEYNTPEVEVTKFDVEDIITASGLVESNTRISVSYTEMF